MSERKNKENTSQNNDTLISTTPTGLEINSKLIDSSNEVMDESVLFKCVTEIIENRKCRAAAYANSEVTLMYWEVGRYINSVILDFKRAKYGEKIFATLSRKLVEVYGNSFEEKNLYRMMQFANTFTDITALQKWSCVLSWSHFRELIRVKSDEARAFYANDAVERQLGVRDLMRQISRKAYERREIADTRISDESGLPFNVFKDPYLLDMLGLKDNFLEADLEKAILVELEAFILEFGHGFTFVERQKRMIMDDEDFHLDLLFYHRILKRLVAVELKLGKFKPEYKGQMEFYLRWLDKYERKEGEKTPIGIILCTTASRDQIELMEMDKVGIAVAEYWTVLPSKVKFERKISEILQEAKERLNRRKSLTDNSGVSRQIEYFIEPKDADVDS
ncbi:MAG: PDDEXK nuclease domain-containing protein [Nitrososphaerota archaeon]|jgi:predicted nuclease of restriction endonuclease-like (RecB) superfamily|nr:PDDEXK nuclease domain-containing protein [Nitrososphaerota archaeon]